MAAPYFKAEDSDLFSTTKLVFERACGDTCSLVKEDAALYGVHPARKKIG